MFPRLPAGEFGGELGEKVAGSTAAGLRERGGIVGEGGRGRWPVVRGRAAVPQLATVEGAAAGGAAREAQAVRCGGVGNAVNGRHRVPLAAGRRRDTAKAEEEEGRQLKSEFKPQKQTLVFPLQTCSSLYCIRSYFVFYSCVQLSQTHKQTCVYSEGQRSLLGIQAYNCNGKTVSYPSYTVPSLSPKMAESWLFLRGFLMLPWGLSK